MSLRTMLDDMFASPETRRDMAHDRREERFQDAVDDLYSAVMVMALADPLTALYLVTQTDAPCVARAEDDECDEVVRLLKSTLDTTQAALWASYMSGAEARAELQSVATRHAIPAMATPQRLEVAS